MWILNQTTKKRLGGGVWVLGFVRFRIQGFGFRVKFGRVILGFLGFRSSIVHCFPPRHPEPMPGGFSHGRTRATTSGAQTGGGDKGAKDQVWEMVKLEAKEPETEDQDWGKGTLSSEKP